ncbi:MAG: AbrB/MazE/SpoVT family DNA-binding domain-containing protein [Betaproteobacteria bacterium]|nr:AbrB/MazE/SpoVT family DNA-binding domain-containing protein [Betaproteobacteria bacterium]
MTTVNLSVKGQVTIPARLRKLLGLEAGDRVCFSAEGGRVYIEKEPDISVIFGVIKARKSAMIAQMDAAIKNRKS